MITANSDATSFSDKNMHYFEEKTADTQLATVVMKTGSLLSSSNTTNAAINMARSALLTQANTSIQQWLKQFGTARVQFNVNDHFHLKGNALDLRFLYTIAPNRCYLLSSVPVIKIAATPSISAWEYAPGKIIDCLG